MANKYGEAALIAARAAAQFSKSPVDQWADALQQLHPTSPTARKKAAPRGAFLGLCAAGFVKGIAADPRASSSDNANYAIAAATLLLQGTEQRSISALWRQVTNGEDKVHNGQMDVVLALWKNGLIVHP
jgi:hypothetical protein